MTCYFCETEPTGHRNYEGTEVRACPKHLVARIKDLPEPRTALGDYVDKQLAEAIKEPIDHDIFAGKLPPRPTTPRQSVRVKDDLWHRFIVKARENGTTGSEVLRERIEEYVSE